MTWYVAIVARAAHKSVERELALRDCASFYPRLKRWVTHARRKTARERPLLGQYVFAEIDKPNFDRISTIQGLRRFLTNTRGEPVPIPDDVVFNWRFKFLRGDFDLTKRAIPVGAIVRIASQQFEGELAIVTHVSRSKMLTVRTKTSRTTRTLRSQDVAPA